MKSETSNENGIFRLRMLFLVFVTLMSVVLYVIYGSLVIYFCNLLAH